MADREQNRPLGEQSIEDEDVGGEVIGKGPFDKGLHETKAVLWFSVLLMVIGVCLLGGGVIALRYSNTTAIWLVVAGAVVGGVGGAIALRNRIMDDAT